MSRVIIKLKAGTCINIPADGIDYREGWVVAWNGDNIVAIAKGDEVSVCYLSEKKEGQTMKKYLIKAYRDYEYGLKEQTKIITAKDEEEAWIIAWKTFPEYHEIGVWEEEDT